MGKGARLTRRRIDPEEALESVRDPRAGAVVLVLGTVRAGSGPGGQALSSPSNPISQCRP